jgi:hypothetical protein
MTVGRNIKLKHLQSSEDRRLLCVLWLRWYLECMIQWVTNTRDNMLLTETSAATLGMLQTRNDPCLHMVSKSEYTMNPKARNETSTS